MKTVNHGLHGKAIQLNLLTPGKKGFIRLLGSVLFLFCSFVLPAQDQGRNANDLPTWRGSQSVKNDAGDGSSEIGDVFTANAVTYQQMMDRASTHQFMPNEMVVAIEMPASKLQAKELIKKRNWIDFFGGQQVVLISRLMTVDRKAGSSVSLLHFKLPQGLDVFQAMKIANAQANVLWSSPNFVYNGDPRDVVPNDTRYAEQYHHPLMKNNLAWDITQGSSSVIVAVTDDGTQLTHSDLASNIWVNTGEIAGDGIDNDSNGFIDDVNGWDFSFNNNNPNNNTAGDSHGTHVAGIIGARINNANGVAGVAGLTTVMPIQFYGTGGAPWTAALNNASFTYAVDNGAKIINTSYNIDGFASDPVFLAGLQYVLDNGRLHFNSAGNNSQLNPARQAVTHTILVASTTNTDAKSSFSNYGTGVDVSAPGSSILSTVVGNAYEFYSGTSMSTPNASGSAALIWAANPTWTNYQVAAQLLATADNIDAVNPTLIGLLGSGRINNYAALTSTLPAPKVKSITGLPAEAAIVAASGITGFTVSYNQVMDPASANNLANYELRNAGINDVFFDGDDVVYTISTTQVYRVGTNQLGFQFSGTPLSCGNYKFRILSGGLKNPFNTALDGDGNGTGGDAFVRNFAIGTEAYADADGDGFGVGLPTFLNSCLLPVNFASVGGDCDDTNPNINPGETEICGNSIDDNCDGLVDFIAGPIAAPVSFSNNSLVAIPGTGTGASTGAPASVYPSAITVSGLNGTIGKLVLKLNNFSHTYPSDVDFLLVGPAGQKMVVLSDLGGGTPITNVNLVLDDAAASALPGAFVSGTFRPGNSGATDAFPAPAPASPYASPASAGSATFASVFYGSNPNGVWNLYAVDDAGTDVGSISGWSLEISTLSSLCDVVSLPEYSVLQPGCASATGTITITAPLDAGNTFSIGAGYQVSNIFNNVLPGTYLATVQNASSVVSPPVTIVVNPQQITPTVPGEVSGPVNVCPYIGTGTLLTYSVAPIAEATSYNWVVPPSVTLVGGQGSNSITVTVNSNFLSLANRMFRITASSPCGTSIEKLFYLTAQLAQTPAPIVASTTNVCPSIGASLPITYTIPKVASATAYIWTAQSGTTTITHPAGLGVNDTIITVTFSSGFSSSAITVAASNDCGTSGTRSIQVNRINPSTPGLISGPTNACAFMAPGGTSASYSVASQPNGASYTWSVPLGATGLNGQGSNNILFTYPAGFTSGTVAVVASNGCGNSAVRSLAISRLNPGAVGIIDVVPTALCPNRIFTYSVASLPAHATGIQWTAPVGGTILSGQGTTSISVSYTGDAISGFITAVAQSNCSSSAIRTVEVKLPACAPLFTGSAVGYQKNFIGISETEQQDFFVTLFPNPAISATQVLVRTVAKESISLRVRDLQGRELIRKYLLPNAMNSIGNDLKAGTYMIEVIQGNNRTVKKLIKL